MEYTEAFHCLIRHHPFFQYFFFDRLCPGASFVVGRQRNNRFYFARTMTAQTVALENADDFFIKHHFGRDRLVSPARGGQNEGKAQEYEDGADETVKLKLQGWSNRHLRLPIPKNRESSKSTDQGWPEI